jgi:hypothetical protein
MSRGFLCPVVAAAFFAALPDESARADLITNGGFETGLIGWSVQGASSGSYYGLTGGNGSSTALAFGGYAQQPDSIYQTVPTVAGNDYTLSFWLSNVAADNDLFQVSWEGSIVTEMSPAPSPDDGWKQYTFQVTATTSGSELRLSAYDGIGFLILDDVSLVEATATAVVPSPASATLGMIGAGFTLLRRRR